MVPFLRTAWTEVVSPMLNRPALVQIAALCMRETKTGDEVLLVTSSNGRWILPKGWPIDGMSGSQTALQEAWEEAGVKNARAAKEPIGTYDGKKTVDNGIERDCRVYVYAIEVEKLADKFPEKDKRKRKWVPFDQAAEFVDDADMAKFLRALIG